MKQKETTPRKNLVSLIYEKAGKEAAAMVAEALKKRTEEIRDYEKDVEELEEELEYMRELVDALFFTNAKLTEALKAKEKPRRKVIAIDFDGCLCKDAFPGIGEPNWEVINAAKQAQDEGAALILWTCREGAYLTEAVEACTNWDLKFDAVNENIPEMIEAFGNDCRKVGADEYWDDRAVTMRA